MSRGGEPFWTCGAMGWLPRNPGRGGRWCPDGGGDRISGEPQKPPILRQKEEETQVWFLKPFLKLQFCPELSLRVTYLLSHNRFSHTQ